MNNKEQDDDELGTVLGEQIYKRLDVGLIIDDNFHFFSCNILVQDWIRYQLPSQFIWEGFE